MIDRLFHLVVLAAVATLAVLAAGGLGGGSAGSGDRSVAAVAEASTAPVPTVTLERVVVTVPRDAAEGLVLATGEAPEPATRRLP